MCTCQMNDWEWSNGEIMYCETVTGYICTKLSTFSKERKKNQQQQQQQRQREQLQTVRAFVVYNLSLIHI